MTATARDSNAKQALSKVPVFDQPMDRHKVEERASNQPGAEIVGCETCNNELNNCPNVLINTSDYKTAIEDWLKTGNITDRLHERIQGDKILSHHKFRICIAGCPNGCSRPQIADLGLVGYIRPDLDPAECTACGACQEVCPDQAISVMDAPPIFDRQACQGCTKCRDICPTNCISLSVPGMRILIGGKLGRHPQLAQVHKEIDTPEQAVSLLDKILDDYIQHAQPDERFANYWASAGKELKL